MKVQKMIVGSMLLLSSMVFAAPRENLLQVVTSSKAYAEQTKGQDIQCSKVTEVKTTKKYGVLVLAKVAFRLVVLSCRINPHDGGDAYGVMGLAVMNDSDVLSFTSAYYPQPD